MINKYPYTNFHELNLDWIIGKIRKIEDFTDDTETYINNVILSMIQNGTLDLVLYENYDSVNEALTLSIRGETENG